MNIDTGMNSLLIVSNLSGLSIDEAQIRHELAISGKASVDDLLKVGKYIGFKIKYLEKCRIKIDKLPLPCILEKNDEELIVLVKIEKEKALIFDPIVGKPQEVSTEELQSICNRNVFLLKHKKHEHRDLKFGFKWFIPTIIKYKRPFIEVLVAAFVIQLLGLFSPFMTQVVVDKVLVHNSLTTLHVLAIGLLIVSIFELVMGIARNYVFTNTTNKIDVILSARLYNHLLKLPLRYFETRRVGDTVARVRELENIRSFLTGTPLTSTLDVLFIVVYILVMFFYSTKLTLIVLLSLPFFALLSAIATPLFRKRMEERFNTGAEVQSFLVESVSGIDTVKSMALEPNLRKKWDNYQADYSNANFKSAILSSNVGAIGQFIQKTFDLIILWYGATLAVSGVITVGQLIAFRMLAGRVSGPVLRIVQLWQDFQQTKISVERIGDIFNTKTETDTNATKTRLPEIEGKITFEHVSFRYSINGPQIIKNMSFEIPAGKMVGIVGRSGSGKSTLARLVQRLYVPEAGKVFVDGVNLAIADTAWLRRQIGIVLQENFMFNMTIRENISINNPSAPIERVIEVAKVAGAHDFILELPEAYDTMIGERGTGLSGGQKQRIAIARALLTDPKILIFDEATSALDYESERIIQTNLKEISENRTVLIIAHRLSTLKNADIILSVDKGVLVEQGSPQALLEQDGLFRYLHMQQEGNTE